jgi:lipid-binding SYLF domain-containing protein
MPIFPRNPIPENYMRTDSRHHVTRSVVPAIVLTLPCLAFVAGCGETSMQERITDSIGTLSKVQSSARPVDGPSFREARGVAIVDETQAGLVVSGAGGSGLLVRRTSTGWSAPCVIKVQGFGVGLTLGGEGRSVVIVFSSDDAIDRFVADGSYFLAQAQGTFGDAYGRTSDPVQQKDQVSVWAVAGGVYGTCALGSIGFKMDHAANKAAYGDNVTEWDILDGKVTEPAGHSALASRLDRIAGTTAGGWQPNPRTESTPPAESAAGQVDARTQAQGD